jgi:orotate phosphoribosyltransferase
MPSLFQYGTFTLASGQKSHWKIECDSLTPEDWEALAVMAAERLMPFGGVVGVPRGGLPFATALAAHVTPGVRRLLVAEDVLTTGGSIERFLEANPVQGGLYDHVQGVCVFARGPCPAWVMPLFQMGCN